VSAHIHLPPLFLSLNLLLPFPPPFPPLSLGPVRRHLYAGVLLQLDPQRGVRRVPGASFFRERGRRGRHGARARTPRRREATSGWPYVALTLLPRAAPLLTTPFHTHTRAPFPPQIGAYCEGGIQITPGLTPCPSGMTTTSTANQDETACVVVCPPGQFSPTGDQNSCEDCGFGFYCAGGPQTDPVIEACPTGAFTTGTTSTSLADCKTCAVGVPPTCTVTSCSPGEQDVGGGGGGACGCAPPGASIQPSPRNNLLTTTLSSFIACPSPSLQATTPPPRREPARRAGRPPSAREAPRSRP